MINYFTVLLFLLTFSLPPNTALAQTDFSPEKANKSLVLLNVTGLLGRKDSVNAIALTPNLLLTNGKAVSGLSVKLSIGGKDATLVNIFKREGLALLSYPSGGLTPVLLATAPGESTRNIHVVSHVGEPVQGTLLDIANSPPGQVGMSMSKTLLPYTGAGVFNNCGELIGLYDGTASEKIASAISIMSINKAIKEVSGAVYSKTDCPSELAKRALEEEARILERKTTEAEINEKIRKTEADATARQKAADDALKIARIKVSERERDNEIALAEAEKKSEESLAEIQEELTLAKQEAAEKEELAEEARAAIEAEKLAVEDALRASQEDAVMAESKREEQKKLLLIGAVVLALLAIVFLRIAKRKETVEIDETPELETTSLLSFDVFIRGDGVGVKIPAELIGRSRGVVIGRSAADCDFVIDSPEVSRSHIRLSEKDGILYLEDLGSANGTILNGLKLQSAQLVALHDRDELELAISMFSVEFQER